jgi:bacterioferritin
MKGNPRVIAHLQRLVNAELGVVDLSLLHARIYEDRGFAKLAARDDLVVRQGRASLDLLLRRMLFLGTTPDMSQREPLLPASEVREMIRADLDAQYRLADQLRTAIACCHEERDFQTGAMLGEMLLRVEEENTYWFEQQLGLMEAVGSDNYLAAQM